MTHDESSTDRASVRADLDRLSPAFRGSYQTVEAMAQAFMREAIVRGVYHPGDKLNQDEIAASLGISRIPVRAALRQLEAEGLVSLEPHRGARVSQLKPEEIDELYAIRSLLEDRLITFAMHRITPAGLAELRAAAEAIDAAGEHAAAVWTTDEEVDRRRDFYNKLYGYAGQPRTLRLVEQLRDEVGRYLLLLRVPQHQASHVAFVDQLASGDSRAARQWVREHLANVSTEIQRILREGPAEPAAT